MSTVILLLFGHLCPSRVVQEVQSLRALLVVLGHQIALVYPAHPVIINSYIKRRRLLSLSWAVTENQMVQIYLSHFILNSMLFTLFPCRFNGKKTQTL